MRLIGGVLRLDGAAADAAALAAMAAAMTAEGLRPQMNATLDGPFGLFALDFAAAPEALEPQPEGWLVAADLRLDRPDEFARQFAGRTRGERLVRLLETAGADFPDRIDGDFALALWNKTEHRVWLGRDIMGVRPLAYTYRPGRWFAFASLPKGLHRTGLASRRPDTEALALMFLQTYHSGGDSGFAEIRYLRSGHSLTIGPDGNPPREHRAWRPDPALVGSWRLGPRAAAEELRRLVTEAVAARVPASGAVASELSGGLDSSSITVLAARTARAHGGRVLALSIIDRDHPELPVVDDRHLIEAVLRQEPDLAWFTPSLGDETDGPFDEDLHTMERSGSVFRMHTALRAIGADLILSGVGGDEGASYNGAGLYFELLRRGRWRHLWHELPARARTDGQSLIRAILSRLILPMIPWPLLNLLHRMAGRPVRGSRRLRYLRTNIHSAIERRRWPPTLTDHRPASRIATFADHHFAGRCTQHALLGAHTGIAYSFPLLDRRVIEFALSLPLDHFLADGYARQPFRRAMKGILPEEIRTWRYKYTPMIGGIPAMAAAKQKHIAEAEALRHDEAANAVFDMDAIVRDLAEIPEGSDAMALAHTIAAQGYTPQKLPRHFGAALRALGFAKHLARLSEPQVDVAVPL